MHCPSCGAVTGDEARFCSSCGAALAGAPAPSRVRKTVTIIFADVTGSTSLGETLDPESIRGLMSRYFQEMRGAVERHGGVVEKFIGDAVMAVFGIPRVHEDDALRAVRAAADMREALDRVNDELEGRWGTRLATRIGVNTGEVVTGDASVGQTLVTGDAVNVAARLEQAAKPGEVIIGDLTYRLARDAVRTEALELSLKGKAEPVVAHRLIEVLADVPARRLRDAPLVGRDSDLAELEGLLGRVRKSNRCELVSILGAPGVGKSRLTAEFLTRAATTTRVVRARCLPYGEGITFWPVVEAIRATTYITDEDATDVVRTKIVDLFDTEAEGREVVDRLAQILGLGGGATATHEIFWATRKLVETIARPAGIVLLFEDIHWAEPTFLDLLEYLLAKVEAPALMVCPARPELLESRPSWSDVGHLLRLDPLQTDAAKNLVENLLGESGVDNPVSRRVVEAAEGNPLFLEEMIGMLIDQGLLRRQNGSLTLAGDPSTWRMPATIHGILAARLDGLPSEERTVIGCASVVGRVFEHAAVDHLVPHEVREEIAAHILGVVRRELVLLDVQPDTYRFRHILIRDAAYEGVTKENRAELHERFADWLEASLGERAAEVDEIVGYHLEQAFRYLAELGPAGLQAAALAERAVAVLAAAGRRALQRSDMPAAATLLGRAAALMPPDAVERAELLLEMALALAESGDFERADEAIRGVMDSDAGRDERIRARAAIQRWRWQFMVEPERTVELRPKAESLIRVLESHDDDVGLAQAWGVVTETYLYVGRYAGPAEDAAIRTIEYARRVGDRRTEMDMATWVGLMTIEGPLSGREAGDRLRALLDDVRDDRFATGALTVFRSIVEARRGEFDLARQSYRTGRSLVDDLGRVVFACTYSWFAGKIEVMAGDPEAAIRVLRPDYETLVRLGERTYLSTVASGLAMALCAAGRFDEAEPVVETSRETGGTEDAVTQMEWRRAKAQIVASRGDLEGAEDLIREALAILEATDMVNDQGDALLDLGEILVKQGRTNEARGALGAALARYEQKENLVSARRARDVLAGL